MNPVSMRRFGLAALCGALGAAINSLPIGAVAPLFLGRIVTLPVAILFGPGIGAIAAALGAAGALGGRLAIVTLVLCVIEAVLIGYAARRGKSPLVAGALVWTFVAIALVAAPQWYGVGYLRETVWPIALQLPLNALVSVVLADLLATAAASRRWVTGGESLVMRRIRSYAFHAFVIVSTLPVLLLAAVDSQLAATRQESNGSARLHEAATALREHIDEYLADHVHAVRTMAAALSGASGAAMPGPER